MRITSKGQVTIPIAVRQQLGFLPETEVEFVIDGDTARLRRTRGTRANDRGAAVVARLRGKGDVRMTTAQILALTRGEPKRAQ